MKYRKAIPEDYPVAGADEGVGLSVSENETDSNDNMIFYESDSEIDSSDTDDQEDDDKLPIQQQTSRSGRKLDTGLHDTLIL